MDSEEVIEKEFESKSDRELARDLNLTEESIEDIRQGKGFLRLEEFKNNEDESEFLEVDFELDKMRRRQLQGFVGEKICSLMENRVRELISQYVKSNWILKSRAEIISDNKLGYSIGSHPGKKGEINIHGSMVKHFNASEEDIRDKIQERCVKTNEELFKAFHRVRNPWIDFSFYALKLEGKKEQKFSVKDFSKSTLNSGKTLNIEIPVVKDFKVIALEVKTTQGDEEKLLSKNQREVRDTAQESPFIDFFTLKVDTSFEELEIPESFSGQFRKHS